MDRNMNMYDYLVYKGNNTTRNIENRTTILRHIPFKGTISSIEVAEITGLPHKQVAAILGKMHVKTSAIRRNHNNGDGVLWSVREEYEDEVRNAIEKVEKDE